MTAEPTPLTTHNRKVTDFFDTSYRWWEEVYAETLPRRFFSFEMIRRRELVAELLKKYAGTGERPRILECGCGPGGILQTLDTQQYDLTAIDLNRRFLLQGRETVSPEVEWLQADMEQLPFRDQAFDLVFCVGVLSYLQSDDRAVAELSRVVRPGGTVIIALPNWLMLNKLCDPYYVLVWLPQHLAAWAFGRRSVPSGPNQAFERAMIRRYSPGRFRRLCRSKGLQEKESVSVSFGPLTFWRREILPLRWSMWLSERLAVCGPRPGRFMVRQVANHWITCLEKVGT